MRTLNGEAGNVAAKNNPVENPISFVLFLKTYHGANSERRPNVRWYLRLMVLGLFAACLGVPSLASDKKPGEKGFGEETCGDHGTSVHFEKSPKDAAKKALKE